MCEFTPRPEVDEEVNELQERIMKLSIMACASAREAQSLIEKCLSEGMSPMEVASIVDGAEYCDRLMREEVLAMRNKMWDLVEAEVLHHCCRTPRS